MATKVAPERRDVQRLWNISDWPGKDLGSRVLMVLGKTLAPGRGMTVPGSRLHKAHKLDQSISAGLLYVGPSLPEAYLRAKSPVRVKQVAPSAHAAKEGISSARVVPPPMKAPSGRKAKRSMRIEEKDSEK